MVLAEVAAGLVTLAMLMLYAAGQLQIWHIHLASGLLADHIFELAMASGGSLAGAFGWLVGTGPEAGMALMFTFTCLLGMLTGLSGFLLPSVRNVENVPAPAPLPEAPVAPLPQAAPQPDLPLPDTPLQDSLLQDANRSAGEN